MAEASWLFRGNEEQGSGCCINFDVMTAWERPGRRFFGRKGANSRNGSGIFKPFVRDRFLYPRTFDLILLLLKLRVHLVCYVFQSLHICPNILFFQKTIFRYSNELLNLNISSVLKTEVRAVFFFTT